MEKQVHQESVYSELTRESSRAEQMAYMRDSLGLNEKTAALLYRAERLQEKGQLKQALKYYQQVLKAQPDCTEATENARMTQELLNDQEPPEPKLPRVKENSRYTITEMDVQWKCCSMTQSGREPDIDHAARNEAMIKLSEIGHSRSILKLLDNKLLDEDYYEYTDMPIWYGRARFQVTLIPDKDNSDDLAKDLSNLSLPEREAKEEILAPNFEQIINGVESISSVSKFADAESERT